MERYSMTHGRVRRAVYWAIVCVVVALVVLWLGQWYSDPAFTWTKSPTNPALYQMYLWAWAANGAGILLYHATAFARSARGGARTSHKVLRSAGARLGLIVSLMCLAICTAPACNRTAA